MNTVINSSIENKSQNRSIFKYVLFFLNLCMLLFLILIAYINVNNYTFVENWTFNISALATLLLFFQVIQLRFLKCKYYDFRIWFTLLMYLFFFGRVFLEGFNVQGEVFWDLMKRYPQYLMSNVSLYILCYIQAIFWGLIIYTKINIEQDQKKMTNTFTNKFIGWNTEDEVNDLLFKAGILITLLSAPFKVYVDLQDIIAAQSSGMYYSLTEKTGVAKDFALLLVPGIIALIVAGKKHKNKKMLSVLIVSIVYFATTMILTGDRRYAVTAIISIVLSFMVVNRVKINYLKLIPLTILSLMFLNILSEIRKIRLNGLSDIFSFFSNGNFDIFSTQVIYETFSEFGLSFFSVVAVYKSIPQDIDYLYGISFIGSLVSLLPVGFLFRDFFSIVSISRQVNVLPGNFPVGATLASDSYANFGWFSIIVVIFFGVILSKIFTTRNDFSKTYYLWRYFSLFYILINLIRSSFFEIVRPTFLIFIIPVLIIKVLKNIKE
ncbi:hypothetical protein AYO36_00875 [Exiguobacterium sp. KKBO11]|uniref:O-antigen polymerase n=1 Tax=Exiguobacterium sp. KKBO11 TaxID=1805000 RepID=UPI0007D77903|nr:O-antigen polymerase [Exiguobacterium sp. KKBO11]OAI88723.1 hypothetical protein AYO36_00875 [Exiguobacterium sp. KKBO11]